MIKYAKIFPEELGRICQGDELILDVVSAMYNSGREKLVDEKNTVTFDPLNGISVESWNDAALQAIGGLTLDLRRGRQARDLAQAAENPMGFLVLTSRRLLVIDGLRTAETPKVLFSTELASVAVLRHDPRLPLELGRMLVGFVDGSMVRLWAGLVSPFAARRFAASFRSATGR